MFDSYRDLFLIHGFNFSLRGTLGFLVLRFWLFLDRFFGFCAKNFDFSVLVFIAICTYSVFQHLVFGFREKYSWVFAFDIRNGFGFFLFDLFGFRFLFNLSGNYAPPLISNSC